MEWEIKIPTTWRGSYLFDDTSRVVEGTPITTAAINAQVTFGGLLFAQVQYLGKKKLHDLLFFEFRSSDE